MLWDDRLDSKKEKQEQFNLYLAFYTKINSRQSKNLIMKHETIKALEKNWKECFTCFYKQTTKL